MYYSDALLCCTNLISCLELAQIMGTVVPKLNVLDFSSTGSKHIVGSKLSYLR